ncbi:MAG: cell envelope integrity protein CreD [Spirochaetaceae bacterium]|jgi:inner membrane protein|nr:cell envelope integrity protein CreD [Spirochaetaceae bacterium]
MERFKAVRASRGFKVFLLLVLILLFLIPTGMIQSLIFERQDRSLDTEEDIMRSWGAGYLIQGPVIRVPCKERTRTVNRKDGKVEIHETDFDLWIVPQELRGTSELRTELKKRGIFSVPLFTGTIELSGYFDPAAIRRELTENQEAFPARAELVIALASQRGIRKVERALWNQGELNFSPGVQGLETAGNQNLAGGIYAAAEFKPREKNNFDIVLEIQGGKSLNMIPLGENSIFDLKADWPAPSFQGSYLPVSHSISGGGFEAHWEISHLSRSIPLAWRSNSKDAGLGANFSDSLFGVDFFKVLDHYNLNTRAVKYALLFIIIPFLSFFLFEIFLKRNIHPVQYLLAGIGNVVFYLLLLSLSEHIAFAAAYGISAAAVIIMTSLYSRSLLDSWGKSWLVGFIMLLCYSFLYFTLQSEDWALLAGSVAIFLVTALVMFLTRRLDWKTGQDSPGAHGGEDLP